MTSALKVAVVTAPAPGSARLPPSPLANAGYQVAFAGASQELLDAALSEAGVAASGLATDVRTASVKALFAAVRRSGARSTCSSTRGHGRPAVADGRAAVGEVEGRGGTRT